MNGEITGERFLIDDIDTGMPIRSNFVGKKNDKGNRMTENKFLDFDIFDKNNTVNNKASYNYNDSINNLGYSSINEIDNTGNNLIEQKLFNNYKQFNNEYVWFFYSNIEKYMNTSFLLNLNNILNIFGMLYIGSMGETQTTIKNYFSLPDKQTLFQEISLIKQYLKKNNSYFMNDFILLPKTKKYNERFLDYISNNLNIKFFDPYDNEEYYKLNHFFEDNLFKVEHISGKDGMIVLTNGYVIPNFKQKFHSLKKINFMDNMFPRQEPSLYAENNIYNYYDDDSIKILEIDSECNKVTFGFILTEENSNFSIDNLNEFINKMKRTQISQVIIPKINLNFKFRYSSILKKSGLETLFYDCTIPELTKNNIKVIDVIQNTKFILHEKNNLTKNINQKQNNYKINFILNKSFVFYTRLVSTGMIISIGQYI